MEYKTEQGQMGVLIGILLAVLTIGYLFVIIMSAPTNEAAIESGIQPMTASGTVPTNQIERYKADMNAAEEVQDAVNSSVDDLNRSLQEF